MSPVKEIENPVTARMAIDKNAEQKRWTRVEMDVCKGCLVDSEMREVRIHIYEKDGRKEATGIIYRDTLTRREGKKPLKNLVFGPEELLEGVGEAQE